MTPAWCLKRLKVSPPQVQRVLLNTTLKTTPCAVMLNHRTVMVHYASCRWHQAGVGTVPRGPVVPAQRLAAAVAVPGGFTGRPGQLPLHRLDWPRHGVQTHRARGGERLRETLLNIFTNVRVITIHLILSTFYVTQGHLNKHFSNSHFSHYSLSAALGACHIELYYIYCLCMWPTLASSTFSTDKSNNRKSSTFFNNRRKRPNKCEDLLVVNWISLGSDLLMW